MGVRVSLSIIIGIEGEFGNRFQLKSWSIEFFSQYRKNDEKFSKKGLWIVVVSTRINNYLFKP
jgi:hypothetical protein